MAAQNQIWENCFLGKTFFPDFGTQIGQQHYFIIWKDGQTPDQLFSKNVYQNGRTGKRLYPIFVILGQWPTLANPSDQNVNWAQKMVNKGL